MENIKEALISLAFIYACVIGVVTIIGFFTVRNFLKKWILVHPEEIDVPGVGKVTLYRMRKSSSLGKAFASLNRSLEEISFTKDEIFLIKKHLASLRNGIEPFLLRKNDSKVTIDVVHFRSLSGEMDSYDFNYGAVWAAIGYRRFIVRSKPNQK